MMTRQRGPRYSQKCPFHITPNQPLTAQPSVTRCVACVSYDTPPLQRMKADLHQIAYLTIVESTPEYNPAHDTGASFTTFIRSRVCGKLWSKKKKVLKSRELLSRKAVESDSQLTSSAPCQWGGLDEAVCWQVDVETFKPLLPKLMLHLSEKEAQVLKMKFFDKLKAVEIAKRLGISQGRVSQLSQRALTKLEKVYLKEQARQRQGIK